MAMPQDGPAPFRVKVHWAIKIGSATKHSGWVDKNVPIDTSLEAHWACIKSSIERSIDVPKHRKLVDSLCLFQHVLPEDDRGPLDLSKTFKELFGAEDMPQQLVLYTDYYNPNSSGNSSGRTGKRKRQEQADAQ